MEMKQNRFQAIEQLRRNYSQLSLQIKLYQLKLRSGLTVYSINEKED